MVAMLSWVESLALPVAPAGHSSQAGGGDHGQGMAMEHPCCPHTSLPGAPPTPPPEPTGNLHRCCFLRVPEAPPANNEKVERPESAANSAPVISQPEAHTAGAAVSWIRYSSERALRFHSETSVVLRY